MKLHLTTKSRFQFSDVLLIKQKNHIKQGVFATLVYEKQKTNALTTPMKRLKE